PAAIALHLLQPLPAQRPEEPDGLLRAAAVRRPRRHGRAAHDGLPGAPDPARSRPRGDRAMIREQPVTAVQRALHRRWRLLIPLYLVLALIVLVGTIASIAGLVLLWQLAQNRTPHHADIVEAFKYGSIGA